MPFKVSDKFKQAMKAPIKQVQAKIIDGGTAYSSSDVLSSFSIEQNGYFFGAAVKVVEFKLLGTDYDLLDHTIQVSFDAQTDSANDVWETLNYGAFKVKEQTADLEKSVTSFKAYDLIGLAAYQEYSGTDIEFPCTLKSMIEQTAIKLSSSISTDLTTLPNYDYEIKENLYEKITGTTYRNILAEIAGATATMCTVDDDGKLSFIAPPQTTEEKITYADMIKIKLEPEYGPVNTVTLSRQPQEDNIVVQDRPYGTASGKEIEITDPGDSLKSLSLVGDCKQTTYDGNQVFKGAGLATASSDTSFWHFLNIAQTVVGNGYATFTNNTSSTLSFANMFIKIAGADLEADTAYTLIAEISDISGTSSDTLFTIMQGQAAAESFGVRDSVLEHPSGSPLTNESITRTDRVTFQTPTAGFYVITATTKATLSTLAARLFFSQFPSGAKATLKYSIIKGDHSSDWRNYCGSNYQPYTGGEAAPNPDYPQEIKTVTGRQVIIISGKNLQDTSSYENKYINANGGLAGGGGTNALFDYVEVESNMSYTVSVSDNSGISSAQFALFDSDKNFITRDVVYGHPNRTITTPSDCKYLRMWVYRADGWTQDGVDAAEIQLEKGSVATEFKSYSRREYEINLGKNLFDKGAVTSGHLINRANGELMAYANYGATDYIPVQPGEQYTFTGFNYWYTAVYDKNKNYLINVDNTPTITIPDGACYLRTSLLLTNLDTAQFEFGSTATSYASYFKPIKLYRKDGYNDMIHKNGASWSIHREFDNITFKESDITLTTQSYANIVYARIKKIKEASSYGNYSDSFPLICTHARHYHTSGSWDNKNNMGCISSNASMGEWWIGFPIDTTQEAARSLLTGAELYYTLKTATETEITNPELIKQLEAANVAELYPDYIKIKTESEDVPATLDLEYYKPFTPHEVKLANNEILDDDRELLAQPILDAVNGFSFYPFEARTTGHGWHKPGDRIRATDGTNTWDLIVTYVKTELSASGFKETIKGVAPTETQTNYALAGGITKTVYNTEIKVDKQNQQIESIVSEVEELNGRSTENYTQIIQNITNINNTIQTSGGNNLLYNSVGYATDTSQVPTVWDVTGTVTAYTSPESLTFGAKSGNQINLAAGASISQTITTATNEPISLSARVKKGKVGAVTIKIAAENGNSETITIEDQKEYVWQEVSISAFEPTSSTVTVTITADSTVTSFAMTDLMLVSGDHTTVWQQASGEILNANVLIDKDGIVVKNNVYAGDYVQITPLEFAGYSAVSGYTQKVFSLNRDTTQVQKLAATGQISMPPIKIVPITSGSRAGWAFVKGN